MPIRSSSYATWSTSESVVSVCLVSEPDPHEGSGSETRLCPLTASAVLEDSSPCNYPSFLRGVRQVRGGTDYSDARLLYFSHASL